MCASDENDWFTKENFINRNVEYVNISYVFKKETRHSCHLSWACSSYVVSTKLEWTFSFAVEMPFHLIYLKHFSTRSSCQEFPCHLRSGLRMNFFVSCWIQSYEINLRYAWNNLVLSSKVVSALLKKTLLRIPYKAEERELIITRFQYIFVLLFKPLTYRFDHSNTFIVEILL